MKTLVDIKKSLYSQSSIIRSLSRLSDSEEFEEAYSKATEQQKIRAMQFIHDQDKEGLQKWIREQIKNIPELMSIRDLRLLGQKLGVSGYNYLTKGQLIARIKSKGHTNE